MVRVKVANRNQEALEREFLEIVSQGLSIRLIMQLRQNELVGWADLRVNPIVGDRRKLELEKSS
jgi:hypothetical protein